MYGFDLTKGDGNDEEEMKPSDFWVTYLAADKYLVEELKDELILGSMNRLNKFNVCLLLDQFLKIPLDEIGGLVCKEKGAILNGFKKFIQAFSKDAFGSEAFNEIEKDTLIHLLSLEFLNLSETDVLNACLRWTNAEVKRQGLVATIENKQKVFSQVKHFVRFTDLEYDELSKLSELKEVLTRDELASLFLKLTGECDQIAIECKTERQKSRKVYEVESGSSSRLISVLYSEFRISLRANRKVCITSIQTVLSSLDKNLELKVFKCEQGEFVPLAFLEFKKYLVNGDWCFEPGRALEIDSGVSYKFVFSFAKDSFYHLYTDSSFRANDNIELSLSDFGKYHCIKRINFCEISNYENAKPTSA